MNQTPPEYLTVDGVKWEIAYKGMQGDKITYYLKSLTPEPSPEPPNPYTLTQSEFEANKSTQLQALSRIVKALAALVQIMPPIPTDGYSTNSTTKIMSQLAETISAAQFLSNQQFYPIQIVKTPNDSQS